MSQKNNQKLGLLIILTCGTLWGLSGVLGQMLFQTSAASPEWITAFRLIVSGIFILIFSFIKKDHTLFDVWKNKKDILSLFIFSIFGVMALQYAYFVTISASNAATATVLQYTYPVLMLFYTAFSTKKLPSIFEIIAILFACLGIFLIATHGNLHSLSLSTAALFWGLAAAVSFVFYTVYPQKTLFERLGMVPIMGWSFLIGGITLSLITRSYSFSVKWSVTSVNLILTITFFGTLIPFLAYGIGVRILGNLRASLFVTVEPIISALLTVLLTKQRFSIADIIGFLCIIGAIELIAVRTLKAK